VCAACRDDVRELESFSRTLHFTQERSSLVRRLGDQLRSWQPWNMRVLVPAAALGGMLLVVLLRVPTLPPEQPAASPPVAAAPPAVTIRDGSQVVSIADNGTIGGLDTLSGSTRDLVERAVKSRQVDAPALSDLTGPRGVLLGTPTAEETSAASLSPAGTVVESDRPLFKWVGSRSARYLVSVYDESFNEVGKSGWISTTEWAMSRPLRRGQRYSWQLTVRRNGVETIVPVPPAPEVRFRVLGADESNEVRDIRSTHGESHLVLVITYARLGLLDDADREMQALLEQNPNSPIVAELAASLKQRRGQ
jgi:hypothetical protein